MLNFFAQVPPPDTLWAKANGSSDLWTWLAIGLVVGLVFLCALLQTPPALRKFVVGGATFFAGLYWVLFYLWPTPIAREDGQLPRNAVEGVGFWLKDANGVVVGFTQILTTFLLGLGIYSLFRVHFRKVIKAQKDWFFSATLLVSLFLMVFFGYADWVNRLDPAKGALLDNRDNWGFVQYGRDFLFEGLLQQMDAAMFSVIAFYILSAAYRAFRIRSVEATILLATATLLMLSLMGAVTFLWDSMIRNVANGNPLLLNLQLTEISQWLRNTFQTASLRGIAFGVNIGALAMGLRLWLSLERTGGNG